MVRLAILILLVLSAGCLSDISPENTVEDTRTPTTSVSQVTTTKTTISTSTRKRVSFDCGNISLPPSYPLKSNLTVRKYPDKPANWSVAGVRQYAISFERAYMWNHEIDTRDVDDVSLGFTTVDVTRDDNQYLVHMEVGLTVRTGNTTGHRPYVANYLITPQGVRRNWALGTKPDPTANRGPTVSCF